MCKAFLFICLILPLWTQAAEIQNLSDIYQLALTNDPTLASAQSANLATQEKLAQARSLFFPTITFSINATHSDADVQYIGGTRSPFSPGKNSFESLGYSASFTQPIFRKQNNVQYAQAKLQVSQADLQLLLFQQDLMLRSSQAYFDVLLAQDRIDLINAQKVAINKQLEQARANFEVGTATITDVNEAKARFDLIVAQEIAAINDLEIKRRAVQSITGLVPARFASVNPDIIITLPEPQDMQTWVQIAEQNNLNLSIQQRTFDIASQEIEKQRAAYYPTLDAVSNYNDSSANGSAQGFGSDSKISQFGLQLQIPIYQGGLYASRVREAVANKQRALDDVEVARRKAEFDTRQAYLNLTGSVSQVQAYEQALSSSQSQVDSTSLGYEVGVRTSVDVLNAQQQFFSAQRDLLQARYTYLLSIIKLKSATGLINEADLADINKRLVERQTVKTPDNVIITPLAP